jgi:hypothetical protein
MAHVRKTARPVDSFEATDAVADEAMSFEFGPARTTLEDLDEFAKCGWFSRDLARLLEGEVVLDPRDDEVVVYYAPRVLHCWIEVSYAPSSCGGLEEV